jgi:tRNA-2-methylthio-N6-dimethylallyladenosine synthase
MTFSSDISDPQIQPIHKVHIETWGCQMNVADSEQMLALMNQQSYGLTEQAEDADVIILNTCHIREKAKHKVLSRLGRLKDLKKQNPNLTIVLAGCVAQAEGKKLLAETQALDIVVGPGTISQLPELVAKHKLSKTSQLALGFKDHEHFQRREESQNEFPTISGKNEISRYINIQHGCNNFCTFCVVPFTRGNEVSQHPDAVIEKIGKMVASGAAEITLLGQNVNSYGLDLVKAGLIPSSEKGPFVDLLKRAGEIPGVKRLRFTTSNPHDFSESLAQLFAERPVLGRYIHLPVQSGHDRMLEAMKRKVTVEQYWQRIHWLQKYVDDIAISTDLIVGFPGETDDEFEGTYELVKAVRYSFIYAFKYSPRKNTAAIRFKDQISEEVKTKRLSRLNELQDKITLEWNEKEVGQLRPVLFHYESKKEPGIFYGRTPHFRLVRVRSQSNLVGQEIELKIDGCNKTALTATLTS